MRSEALSSFVVASALVTALGFGCSDTAISSGAPPDGTVADAAFNESGSSPDAAADAGGDANGGVAEDPFPGAWGPVPGVPPYCEHKIAMTPAALASKWAACPSGRSGCRKLETSWTSLSGWKVDVSKQTDPVRIVAGVPYLKMRRYWPSPKAGSPYAAYVDIIEPLDGVPVVAMGTAGTSYNGQPRWCSLEATFGDAGIGFSARPRDPSLPLSEKTHEIVFGWAAWSAPSTFTTKTVVDSDLDAPDVSISSMTIGDVGVWLGVKTPSSVALFNSSTQTGAFLQTRPQAEHPIAISGGALFFETTEPFSIARAKNDGTWTRLITPTSPQFVTWMTLDRSNADAIVWVESEYGVQYVNSTIWTAPLAAAEGQLVRKKVAKFEDVLQRGGSYAVANKGVILTLVDRNKALLTRIADGMGWFVQGEPNERFTAPVWVDDQDVLIETAPDDTPGQDRYPSSILRISRATLGTATIPSGL